MYKRQPLFPLVAFLWRYTWAALPQPLRAPLVTALNRLYTVILDTTDATLPSRGGKKLFSMEEVGISLRFLTSLFWLLEGDSAFVGWQRTAGEAGKLPPADEVQHQPKYPGQANVQERLFRCALPTVSAV